MELISAGMERKELLKKIVINRIRLTFEYNIAAPIRKLLMGA